MKKPKVTISVLAKDLGLSTATISRAMNHSTLITPDVIEKVQVRAKELGYVSRPVKKQRDRAILNVKLVLPHRDQPEMQLFYDLSELIQGIRKGAGSVKVQLVSLLESETHQIFDHKKGGHIDAVLFAFCEANEQMYKELDSKNIPYLSLNRSSHGGDYVVPNTDIGFIELLETMKASLKGNEKFNPLFLNLKSATSEVQKQREKSFLNALDMIGLEKTPLKERVWKLKNLKAIDDDLVEKIEASSYNAICCFNDVVAASLIQYLPTNDKLAVGGYDYSPFVHMLKHKLTTVSMEVNEFGLQAGEWLVKKVIDKDQKSFREKVKGRIVVVE